MFPNIVEMKLIRERLGWSQIELAKKVGISQSAVTKYESGNQIPSYEIGIKIFETLLDEDLQLNPSVTDLMTTEIITVDGEVKFGSVLDIMRNRSISQVPVLEKQQVIGTITETLALDLLNKHHNLKTLRDENTRDVMEEPLPIVPESAKLKQITPLLRFYGAVIVNNRGNIVGIVTKADLLVI